MVSFSDFSSHKSRHYASAQDYFFLPQANTNSNTNAHINTSPSRLNNIIPEAGNDHSHRRYLVFVKKLDSGSFGQVDLYNLVDKNKYVAQKKIIKSRASEKRDQQAQMVKREVSIMQALKQHPSPFILGLLDSWEDANAFYMLMDYIAGDNLLDVISQTRTGLEESKAKHYLRGIAKGVAHLHRHCVAHRDIKHENIMIQNGQTPVLIDFGLSKILKSPEEKMQTACGSLEFVAPEVIYFSPANGGYHLSADDWSIGMVLMSAMLRENIKIWGSPSSSYTLNPREKLKKLLERFSDKPLLRDFLAKVLTFEPQQRLKTFSHYGNNDLLEHPWLSELDHHQESGSKVPPSSARRTIFFHGY